MGICLAIFFEVHYQIVEAHVVGGALHRRYFKNVC